MRQVLRAPFDQMPCRACDEIAQRSSDDIGDEQRDQSIGERPELTQAVDHREVGQVHRIGITAERFERLEADRKLDATGNQRAEHEVDHQIVEFVRAGDAVGDKGQRDEDRVDRGVRLGKSVAQREEQRASDQEDRQLVQEADVQRGPDQCPVAGPVIGGEQREGPRLEQADIDEMQHDRERDIEMAARAERGDQQREDEKKVISADRPVAGHDAVHAVRPEAMQERRGQDHLNGPDTVGALSLGPVPLMMR